ncbi:dienelactone hydrolase family protein [Bordetella petrii]|nr:dienelactone hydrolase family protein [Bordetella petrii]
MDIELKTEDGQTISAYRAGDANAKRGLVVLQEIFGVNGHIRDVCETFAKQGYDVIAPALFDRAQKDVELGYTGEDVQAGLALRAKVDLADTLKDIEAAIKALAGKPVAIVGYCWGGALAWQAACKLGGLAAASCWYGGGIAQAKDLTPKIPVQMHFGGKDGSIPMSDVEAIQAAQPNVEFHVYPEAGHGFGCDQRGSYDAAAYQLAQERTLRYFDQHLS